MPVGAGIMGAATLGSSAIGALGASNAASQQVAAQQQVLAAIQGTINPIIQTGSGMVNAVNPTLQGLLTGNGQGAAGIQNTLNNLPGYQFAQNWGKQAVQNLGTTSGLGGNVLTAGANYATGLAQQNYGQYVNQLQGYLNTGLQTETNAASTLASGEQSALSSIGNAQAAGTLGTANALSGGLSSLGNTAALYSLLSKGSGGSSLAAMPSYNGLYTNSNSVLSGLGS